MEFESAGSVFNLSRRWTRRLCVGLIGVVGVGLAGCETADEHRTATGAVLGTLLGAAAGAAIADDDDRTKGALIGAAAGAAVGGGIGYLLERQKEDLNEIEGVEAREDTVYVPDERTAAATDGRSESLSADAGASDFIPERGLTMTLGEAQLFSPGSASLTAQGTHKVAEIAQVLRDYPESDVFIMGYTGAEGDRAYQVQLSQSRADAMKNTLIANRIDPARITSLGMGASNPIAPNDTEAGRRQNRRVEVIVVPRESAAA